jgi:hypothetical protein
MVIRNNYQSSRKLEKLIHISVLALGMSAFAMHYNFSNSTERQHENTKNLSVNIEGILQKEEKYFKPQNYTIVPKTPYRLS